MCSSDKECLSTYCDYGFCRGQDEGETCVTSYDCNPDLYCNYESSKGYSTCTQVVELGNYCNDANQCSVTMDCVNNTCEYIHFYEENEFVGAEKGKMCLTGGTDADGYCREVTFYDNDKRIISEEKQTVKCKPDDSQYCFPYTENSSYVYFDSGFLNTMIPLGHSNYYDCHCVDEDVGGCLVVGSKYWTAAMTLYQTKISDKLSTCH